MVLFRRFVLVLFAACSAVEAGMVRELTDATFEAAISGGSAGGGTQQRWFVMFYAPWCGHCKTVAPILQEVADELDGAELRVGRVDSPENPLLHKRFRVKGFPTFRMLEGGKMFAFEGARTKQALADFAEGGYREAKGGGEPMPAAAGALDFVWYHAKVVRQDFDTLLAHKKNVLLVTFAIGAAMGMLLVLLLQCCRSCCCGRGSRDQQTKEKSA